MITRFYPAIILLILCYVLAAAQTPQLVDVGGYHLDVVRAGSGTPPLILVGGLGNAVDTWAQIVPSAAQFSTVVAYSRGGLGRSEAGPSHHTARDSVLELHALLAKLNLKPPYVLVGASYGGILVRLGEACFALIPGYSLSRVRREVRPSCLQFLPAGVK